MNSSHQYQLKITGFSRYFPLFPIFLLLLVGSIYVISSIKNDYDFSFGPLAFLLIIFAYNAYKFSNFITDIHVNGTEVSFLNFWGKAKKTSMEDIKKIEMKSGLFFIKTSQFKVMGIAELSGFSQFVMDVKR